jgi:glycosyltransferase involved in cell wall biosynthesis
VKTIYIDIKDLLEYAQRVSSVSGIQRVIANLVKNLRSFFETSLGLDFRLVIPEYSIYRLISVDLDTVLAMIDILENQHDNRTALNGAIELVFASRVLVKPLAGDIFVMVGAFWHCDNFTMMARLRGDGVLFGLFIHDLIQIRNPEYVHHAATEKFRQTLIDALTTAHFVITNSRFVADDVQSFLNEQLNFSLPIRAVPLATELPQITGGNEPVDIEAASLPADSFVLCVGTLEIRKNQMFLIRIWERLVAEFASRAPDLVFVGKWGYKAEELKLFVEKGGLRDRIHILETASDVTLRYLYQNCLFTAYPSLAEGFGLPIGESLAYGKPCVAANTTSLPEVGQDFARYVDPLDVDQGYQVFRSILADPSELGARKKHIGEHFRPKTWSRFAAEFCATTVELADQVGTDQRDINGILEPGATYQLGIDKAQVRGVGGPPMTLRTACVSGWHDFEHWGCWASAPEARIRFKTRSPESTAVAILMELHVPLGSRGVICKIDAGGPRSQLRPIGLPRFHLALGRIGKRGMLEIRLNSSGRFANPDPRRLYVGLHSLSWCPTSDLATLARFHRTRAVSTFLVPLSCAASLLFTGDGRLRFRFLLGSRHRLGAATVGTIEIDLGSGRRLKVSGDVDPAALAQMLDELERRSPT